MTFVWSVCRRRVVRGGEHTSPPRNAVAAAGGDRVCHSLAYAMDNGRTEHDGTGSAAADAAAV